MRFRWTWIAACLLACLPAADTAHESRFFVTPAGAGLIEKGLAAASASAPAGFQPVPSPGVRYQPNVASATVEPWIDSTGSRFERGLSKANYEKLKPGSAPLAAAEAFAYGADAMLDPAPEDVPELEKMLSFLKTIAAPALPVLANIGVVDDGSAAVAEVLNLLTRRNLLYRVVKEPDPRLDVNVKLGSPGFPAEAARNPSDFAARVRQKLTDERRLVRLFGTSITTAHLTGDGNRARLFLLNYGRSRFPQSVRVRVRAPYTPVKFAGYKAPEGSGLTDIEYADEGVEFTIPVFHTLAVIDLEKKRP